MSKVERVRIVAFAALAGVGLAAPALHGCGGSSSNDGAEVCAPCVKAAACCTAYETQTNGDPSSCGAFKDACNAATGSARDQLITQCQTFTAQTAAGVPSPTQCR